MNESTRSKRFAQPKGSNNLKFTKSKQAVPLRPPKPNVKSKEGSKKNLVISPTTTKGVKGKLPITLPNEFGDIENKVSCRSPQMELSRDFSPTTKYSGKSKYNEIQERIKLIKFRKPNIDYLIKELTSSITKINLLEENKKQLKKDNESIKQLLRSKSIDTPIQKPKEELKEEIGRAHV